VLGNKAGQTNGASCLASRPPLLGVVSLGAARDVNPVSFAAAAAVATRAATSTPALGTIPAPSSAAGRSGHAAGGHHHDASAADDPPPQADFATGPQIPRHPQGVGVAGPGGGAAPSLLSTKVALARMAVSWLRSVSGVAVHLQCPEAHRLERPG
jgi:hypothetical protein